MDQLLDLSSPEAVHFTVSDLLSHLKWTCFSDDFTLATNILSAREDKAARDLHLLEEKRNAFEEEVKAHAKEIHELREQMAKEKDEHQISLSELRGEMERDRKAREDKAMKDRNLFEEKRNALEQVVKSCEEEIGELREQMAKEKTCLFELSGEMERDKRAAKVLVAGLREEQTLEVQARDEKSKKDYNLLEEKCNALEEEVKLCKEEIDELREQMVKKKSCLLKLSGEMERDKRAAEAFVARLRKEQTWEMQARDEKSKKDYNLLEQNHIALMASNLQIQEELESCKKENSELREEMTRLKDEHEKDVVELQGQVTSMECDKRMAETLAERYYSRFENLIMRVKRLEDDAKVLLTPADQSQDDEEATDDNGETRGQPTEEIACGFNEQKKDDPSTFKTDPVMPLMPKIEAINISNKMVPPRNERNSARTVIEISDSDDKQPMGIDDDDIGSYSQVAGGEAKLTQVSGVKLKDSCGFGCPTTPSTSPRNDIESSGTSPKQISWGLRSCGENTRQTNERLLSQINNNAWEDSSSDDWKNEEDMIMTLEKDPEVCIKAICSLHREELFNSFELLSTHHEDMITALEKDPKLCIKASCALRGTALAESIMCGDPYAELEKDAKGIRDCRRIAKVYSKELFEIYKKDKELELQFAKWSEHCQKHCRFLKTKAGPPIFYVLSRPLEEEEEDATLVDMMNLRETTMDQELEVTHRKLPEAGDNDEDEGDRDDTTIVVEEDGNASSRMVTLMMSDDLNEPSSFV